jgi:penicillin-binding protein 1B
MATVITNYRFPVRGAKRGFKQPITKTALAAAVPRRQRIIRRAKTLFLYFVNLACLLLLLGTVAFFYFYSHYSAVVQQRIDSGFWHSRAGVYANSIKLRKGQSLSRERVVEMLRRTGYVEGASSDDIWNGYFIQRENGVEIRNNGMNSVAGESVLISFAGDEITRIASLTSPSSALQSFEIEGELLSGRSESKRGRNNALKYEDIPENLRLAILTAEDQRFFNHYGIDPRGIARALFKNLSEGEIKQGGSTITQQLVKNTFLSPEKSFSRKFSEAFLALALERRMSKEEIFTLYCNEIYLGQYGSNGVHGVEEAAHAYFDKELKDLNLNEAAAIAAMIKNPNRFAPHKNEKDAADRRVWIISEMQRIGLTDAQTAERSKNTELALAKPKLNEKSIAPYFVDSIGKELTTKFRDRDYLNTNFNMRVYSTVDMQLQSLAEQAVAGQLARLDKIYAKKGLKLQATLVSLDPRTGQVLAMVGGRNYLESQFNRATDARRQPGSVFKPFVYATAIERGKSPMNIYNDSPAKFEMSSGRPYEPANYGNAYTRTNISMKTALARSSNVVAVKTALETGLHNIARKAQEFGFDQIDPYPSMALGAVEVTPLQVAAAYSAFANGGKKIEPTFIDKIVDGDGRLLFQSTQSEKQVINPKTAYMMTDMLRAVVTRGTAGSANEALGKNIVFAGKTGSSKDGWFVGYTPNLVTVAWIGLDESEDIKATGGEVALPLWLEYMKSVVETRPEFGGAGFPAPAGLVTVQIDPQTGMLAGPYCPHKESMVVDAKYVSNFDCIPHRPLTMASTSEQIEVSDYAGPIVSTYSEQEIIEVNQVDEVKSQDSEEESSATEETAPAETIEPVTDDRPPRFKKLETEIRVKKPVTDPAQQPERNARPVSREPARLRLFRDGENNAKTGDRPLR